MPRSLPSQLRCLVFQADVGMSEPVADTSSLGMDQGKSEVGNPSIVGASDLQDAMRVERMMCGVKGRVHVRIRGQCREAV